MAKRKYTRKPKESEGLGDTIEKIAEVTGVKKIAEAFEKVTGQDCGCEKRKKYLNDKFRYKKVECMNKEEYDWFTKFLAVENRKKYHSNELYFFINMYARIFGVRPSICRNCSGGYKIVERMTEELKKVYDSYKEV